MAPVATEKSHDEQDLELKEPGGYRQKPTDRWQVGRARLLPSRHAPERECWYISMGAVTHVQMATEELVHRAP